MVVPSFVGPVSQAAVSSGDLSKKEFVALLNIPEHLAQPIKNAGIRVNYAKYKACVQAQETLRQKLKDGTWPAGNKRPTATTIIELFVSRTTWHSYMTQAFHDISHFPLLQEWLEGNEGGPTDAEVWGTVQNSYNFTDLQKEKAHRQQQMKGKGKKKEEDKAGKGKKKDGDIVGKGKKKDEANVAEKKKDEVTVVEKKNLRSKNNVLCLTRVLFQIVMAWIWIMFLTNIPLVAAASREQQPFPDVPFAVFSKFVENHFISTVSLSTVLMVLFTVTENTELLSLHYRQRCAKKSTSATGWIRCLGAGVKKRLDEGKESLLNEFDLDPAGSEYKANIAFGLKLDALAKVLGLCAINQSGKFKGKLKPVSHTAVQPVYTLCPDTATCKTMTCDRAAIYQSTKYRDIPLVKLIKDFKVYEQVQLYSGICKECNTLYYADHERAPSGNGENDRVYLNTARYIKIGQNMWVDRAFSAAVLSGMYTFHGSAAAYTEFWNSAFDTDGKGRMSRRQVWQAFVQESIRLVGSVSDTLLTIRDGLPIDEVTKEAYNVLGENGILRSAHEHECSECTHKYKRNPDVIPDPNGNVSDMVGMEERVFDIEGLPVDDEHEEGEAAPVKMVVIDGIVIGHTHCAFEGCTSDLANARGGVYCALHELRHGGRCHAASCGNPSVEGTLACEHHQGRWRRHLTTNRQQVLGGFRRALRRPDETWPWMPAAPHQVQAHDEEPQASRIRDCFLPPRVYCVETICAPCGVVVAWAKFHNAESPTNILEFLQAVYPEKDQRPAYICIDKACMVLKTVVNQNKWVPWLETSRFIVDAYHYINHRAADDLCRTWCNPAPLNGSAPNLVIAERNAQGQLYYKRAFNTQACEQLNAWLGGFESILKRMTASNFNWFLHTMLFYHTMQVIRKQNQRRVGDEEDDQGDEVI
ncbi:hypothetical protein JOM56_002878 [Amanita muscaria]